jgi:hypothetical protein
MSMMMAMIIITEIKMAVFIRADTITRMLLLFRIRKSFH